MCFRRHFGYELEDWYNHGHEQPQAILFEIFCIIIISSVTCEVFMESTKLFKSPCDSRLIGIHKVHFKCSIMKQLPFDMLQEKAIFVELDSGSAAILSFLHNDVSC
jgi:hypothetical protein